MAARWNDRGRAGVSLAMSEYRDELSAAHARIRQLETELEAVQRPSPPRAGPVTWVLVGALSVVAAAGVLVVGVVGLVGYSAARPSSMAIEAPTPAPTYAPTPKTLGANFYPQHGVVPEWVDVDGDGTPEIVTLAWRHHHDEAAVHAVAIDSKSFALKWASEAVPSQWQSEDTHLVIANERAVVTNSRDEVRILALATGETERTLTYPGGARFVCPGPGGATVLLNSEWGDAKLKLLTLPTGELSAPPKGASCAGFGGPSRRCDVVKSGPCLALGDPPLKPALKGLSVFESWQDGDDRVSVGNVADGPKKGRYLLGSDVKTNKVRWEHPFEAPGDVVHAGGAHDDVAKGVFYTLYQVRDKNGPFRLVARDVKSGEILWSATLPDAAEGTRVSSMGVRGDLVLVTANQTLHVFSTKSGELVRTLSTL